MHPDKQKQLQKPLTADQIDFRVQSINKGGFATILAYKDARVDINRLNEVLGVGKWQRKHDRIGDIMYCSVGVWDDEIQGWSWVQDAGIPSNTEKEKGEASDSFKRACFNLGIGIELYDFPLIQVKLNQDEWAVNPKTQKPQQTYHLKLKEWQWAIQHEGNKPTAIAAKDDKGAVRFKWGAFKK